MPESGAKHYFSPVDAAHPDALCGLTRKSASSPFMYPFLILRASPPGVLWAGFLLPSTVENMKQALARCH